ncbi:unnamed protein product, partial [Protopolystoma xenopodis]
RNHRRYIDRQNKAERIRRKTEENKRVRKFVSEVYELDPRIQQANQAAKEARESRRRAKAELIRQKRLIEEEVSF